MMHLEPRFSPEILRLPSTSSDHFSSPVGGGGEAVEEIIEVVEVEHSSHHQTLKDMFWGVVLDGTFPIPLVCTGNYSYLMQNT